MVDVSGKLRELVMIYEQKLLDLTIKTRINVIKPGDHGKWLELNNKYKVAAQKAKNLSDIVVA